MAEPRITVVVKKGENGEPSEVYFYFNAEGRDLLVDELKHLDERWDHFHMADKEWNGGEIPLMMRPYSPEEETPIDHVKMHFRLDEWDRKYFPHVMGN